MPRADALAARLRAIWASDLAWSFRRDRAAVAATLVLLALVLGSTGAPWLAPHDPYDLALLSLLDSHLPPAWLQGGEARFLLGTDSQGADLFSLILHGMRVSLLVGCLAVVVSAGIGTAMGLLAGFLGGRVDALVMRVADIQFTFPAILLALLIGGIAQMLVTDRQRAAFAIPIVVLALGLSHWPHFARLVRGATLVEKEKDYVAAARLIGRGRLALMVRQILPNTMNPVLVLATLDIAFAIMGEATLSFLGFGMPITQPSLGTLIRTGYAYLFSGEWWLVIFPSLALVVLIVCINLIGDWLRDALNPKLR